MWKDCWGSFRFEGGNKTLHALDHAPTLRVISNIRKRVFIGNSGRNCVRQLRSSARGCDANKTAGRKRHIAVDTHGQPPIVNVTPAGFCDILAGIHKRWP